MRLEVHPEREFYEAQSAAVTQPILALAAFVSVVMGIGAVFGAMNTMHAIVATRTREIATLRVLGFSGASILFGFVLESTLLAVGSSIVGCLLALPADGLTTGTGQNASYAEMAWAFHVTPTSAAVGLTFGALMGILGGLLPAWRAARMPLTAALRGA
jgi:putative ABC transport system permease protein